MFDKELFKLSGMPTAFALLLVSALAQGALMIVQTLALSHVLSELWQGSPLQDQIVGLVAFFVCFAGRHVILFAQDELLDRFSLKQSNALLEQLLGLVFNDHVSLARDMGTAASAQTATRDIDDIARYIRTIPPKMCGVIGVSLPILITLFAVDWVSGIIALVAFPVIIGSMVMIGRQAKGRAERQYEESRRLSNHFIDTLRGMESIKALGAGSRTCAEVGKSSERLRVATMRTLSVATLSGAALDLITVFGVAAVAMMLAFRLMDGSVGLEASLAALILTPEYFAPIRSFASDFHASLDGRTALANVQKTLRSGVDSIAPSTPTLSSWSDADTLEAHCVSYLQRGGAVSLDEVSFNCAGFTKVGIVGASGAGKSTLIDLLAGFKTPSMGSFSINGTPVNLDNASWRNLVHYIPQHPHVFHLTLEENIRFYAPHASREDAERAATTVGLESLVSELPKGLDTVIGEGGRPLSGGEAQRVALARMLLDERPILLFDEPTAHLDLETELELKQRMLPCMEGRLVFFATHRLHWLSDMDLVIVLDNGRVVDTGKPSELLQHEGALRNLIESGRGAAVA